MVIDLENARREMESEQVGASSEAKAAKKISPPAGMRRAGWRSRLVSRTAIGVAILAPIIGAALWRNNLPAGRPEIKSLAVLPLENLSGNPEEEYFAAGVHDALIGELAQIGALRVISRQSSMKYKDSGKSIPEIARELKVDGVVEGSAYREGEKVHIHVRLIQALPQEKPLWADKYERDIRDVLAMYSEVAKAVTREIKVKLTPQEDTRLASARPVDPQAYEAYLRGVSHNRKQTPEDYDAAERYFQFALQMEAGNAARARTGSSERIQRDLLRLAFELSASLRRSYPHLSKTTSHRAKQGGKLPWTLGGLLQKRNV